VPEFNAYFYYQNCNSKGNNNNKTDFYFPTKNTKNFVLIFSDLIKLYYESYSPFVDLSLLKKAVSKLFVPQEQHNAYEFLRYVILFVALKGISPTIFYLLCLILSLKLLSEI